MAIAPSGTPVSGTNSATITGIAAGVVVFCLASRSGSNSQPTIPAGWTEIGTGVTTNSAGSVLCWQLASGTSLASGTFTNAVLVELVAWSGLNTTTPVGGNAVGTNTVATVTYPSITMTNSSGSSWVALFGQHRSTNTTIGTAPTGFTKRFSATGTGEVAAHDSNAGLTSFSGVTEAVGGTASGWGAYTVELLAAGGTMHTASLTGGLSFSGGFNKTTNRSLTAGLSFSGAFSKAVNYSLSAALSFVGNLNRSLSRSLVATLPFVGAFSKLSSALLTATLSFTGTLARRAAKALNGALSFIGAQSRRTNKNNSGTLSFVGANNRNTHNGISGTLGLSVGSGSASASIVQYIEMSRSSQNAVGTANTYVELINLGTKLNTADFDGTVNFYFEVSILNNGTSGQTAYIQLYNHTDGVAVTSSELTQVGPNSGGFPLRMRSGSLSLSGDKVYTVQLKHSNTTINTVLSNARIVVTQSGAITKTQIHQELGTEFSISATSSSNIISGSGQFLYAAANFDGTVTVRHDAVMSQASGQTSNSAIYDVTGAATVTGSTLTSTTNGYALYSSGSITLTDGHVYAPASYVSGSSAVFESSKLVFTITGGFSKYLAYISLINSDRSVGYQDAGNIFPSYDVYVDIYLHWDPAEWSTVAITPYYEANISISDPTKQAWSNLQSYIYATSANSIAGTDTDVTGTTAVSRTRSPTFSLPGTATDLATGIATTGTTNSASEWNAYLVLQISGMGGSGSLGFVKQTNKSLPAGLSFVGSMGKAIAHGLAAALNFVGNLVTVYIPGSTALFKTVTGSLGFAGNLGKTTKRSITGNLSFAGSLNKITARALTAILSFAGSLSRITGRSLTGSLSFVGGLSRTTMRPLTGTLSFVGSIKKAIARSLTGTLSFSGNIAKQSMLPLTASLTSTGSIGKVTSFLASATLSFTGSIAKTVARPFTATLSFGGVLSRRIARSLTATLSFAGSLSKAIKRAFVATLNFVGDFSTVYIPATGVIFKSISGSLGFSGNLNRTTARSFPAALTFVGLFAKQLARSLTGSLSFVGSISKQARKSLSGSLSFVGAFSRTIANKLSLTATLNFAGNLNRTIRRSLVGGLSFVGSISRGSFYKLTASLGLSGNINKRTSRNLTGSVGLSGSIQRNLRRSMAASISFSGTISKTIGKGFTASLGFFASLFNKVIRKPASPTSPKILDQNQTSATIGQDQQIIQMDQTVDTVVALDQDDEVVHLDQSNDDIYLGDN